MQLAREGQLDALVGLRRDDGANDGDVYKWLCAAADFGHDAVDAMSDFLEWSSLRYDDDGYVQAAAHWELARAYLLGEELEVSLELASKHLEHFIDTFTLEDLEDGSCIPGDADEVRARLEGEALAILQRALTPNPYREARRRLERFQRLKEIGSVPKVILQNEAKLLMDAMAALIGDDGPD